MNYLISKNIVSSTLPHCVTMALFFLYSLQGASAPPVDSWRTNSTHFSPTLIKLNEGKLNTLGIMKENASFLGL